jgi:hypothetical protein
MMMRCVIYSVILLSILDGAVRADQAVHCNLVSS